MPKKEDVLLTPEEMKEAWARSLRRWQADIAEDEGKASEKKPFRRKAIDMKLHEHNAIALDEARKLLKWLEAELSPLDTSCAVCESRFRDEGLLCIDRDALEALWKVVLDD